jgi:hypothetical protein
MEYFVIKTREIMKFAMTSHSAMRIIFLLPYRLTYVCYLLLILYFLKKIVFKIASVVWWPEFLAIDPEVRVRFPALTDFLKSSGSVTHVRWSPCPHSVARPRVADGGTASSYGG